MAKKLYSIDTQQIEGKSTDELSPISVFTFGSNALKSELGNIMSDIPNSRSEFISTLYVYKLAYQLLLKTMMGALSVGLMQAMYIYSHV